MHIKRFSIIPNSLKTITVLLRCCELMQNICVYTKSHGISDFNERMFLGIRNELVFHFCFLLKYFHSIRSYRMQCKQFSSLEEESVVANSKKRIRRSEIVCNLAFEKCLCAYRCQLGIVSLPLTWHSSYFHYLYSFQIIIWHSKRKVKMQTKWWRHAFQIFHLPIFTADFRFLIFISVIVLP